MFSSNLRTGLLGLLLLSHGSLAGVTAERTRVVFHEGQREASLSLVNQNTYPVIVQTWIDDGAIDSTPEVAQAPIIPIPPIFRLNPNQQRSLRLLYTEQMLPKDRESLYWLNLYEIPPQPPEPLIEGQSRLTVTLRTQMKVIYRPKGLNPDIGSIPANLITFQKIGDGLLIENPTPYVITLSSIETGQSHLSMTEGPLLPFSKFMLALPSNSNSNSNSKKIKFTWIDDDGNIRSGESKLR